MELKKRQQRSDLLEVGIVLALLFLIITIYVPVAIWEEEKIFEDKSRFRMQNLYDIEEFHNQLTGTYNSKFFEAMNLVNAARDSVIADSNFIGEQTILLGSANYSVDIPESFPVEFDTTFGFKKFRRDTISDTSVTIIMYSEELSRNDTSYIQLKNLSFMMDDPNFIDVLEKTPVERVELVEYYDTFVPDSSTYYCPLTKFEYNLKIIEEIKSLRVASPIVETYKEPRYLIFSFKANSHGMISDGTRSWD
ncbi:MAG: hypothetical protein ISR83_03080 [Candidatus Marinimicrobia bacterium]|nr:hypothetical protein [Candidatus Neomarinimicrobiota bacterium]